MKPFQLLLLLLFTSTICFNAHAQKGLRIGIRAGLNAATTSNGFGFGTSFKDPNYRIGSAFGLLVNIPLAAKLSLQPELNYSSEGSVQDGQLPGAGSGSYTQIFELKTQYLNIPFMLQYRGNAKGLYFEAGPQLGSLLKSKLLTKVQLSGSSPETDVKSIFNSTVISGAIGGGLNISKGIGFGIRYTFSLSQAGSVPSISGDDQKINNSSIFIGMHVKM